MGEMFDELGANTEAKKVGFEQKVAKEAKRVMGRLSGCEPDKELRDSEIGKIHKAPEVASSR